MSISVTFAAAYDFFLFKYKICQQKCSQAVTPSIIGVSRAVCDETCRDSSCSLRPSKLIQLLYFCFSAFPFNKMSLQRNYRLRDKLKERLA